MTPGRPSTRGQAPARTARQSRAVVLYRRAPDLICYWRAARLVVHSTTGGAAVVLSQGALRVLDAASAWASAPDLARAAGVSSSTRVIRALVDRGLLVARRADAPAPPDAFEAWGDWRPAASFFHFATKDTRWATGHELERLNARMRARAADHPTPSPIKTYPGARTVDLGRSALTGEFASVLVNRRTWRGFGAGRLPLTSLSTLLNLTWGAQRWGVRGDGARVSFKTSPSAGTCQPLEAYVLALRVADLSRGLYHYRPDTQQLELVARGASVAQLRTYVSGQWWYDQAAALVVMTAVWPRVLWRYPFPRAYRSVLLEAGHFCQTFCLASTWLGLAPFCTQALADSIIERDLGLDASQEGVVYAAGVGLRPKDGRWVQWPPSRQRARPRSDRT